MSACSRRPRVSSRSARCASPPMPPGGSGRRSRTTSCATGRSCAAAPARRRRRCSSICGGCARGWRKARSRSPALDLPGDLDRARRFGVGRRDDGFAALGARHLAQRAAARRRATARPTAWISWSPTTRCPTRWRRRRSTWSGAIEWLRRCARRAQCARAEDHPRAPAADDGATLEVARRDDGHLQGARAPDRKPRHGEAEVGAGQGQPGIRLAVRLMRPRRTRVSALAVGDDLDLLSPAETPPPGGSCVEHPEQLELLVDAAHAGRQRADRLARLHRDDPDAQRLQRRLLRMRSAS